ncbi:MAG: hypothetical protein ABJ000_18375 [Saccharospirillum sp.]|uniref:hypothetical protein n=1 Tax=Saccharospirillum sp. TaxID=2033801 RepID=UPI00329A7BC2
MNNSEQLFDESDIVFWGRLDSELVNTKDREQLAKFTIIKSYKGEISGQIAIVNELSNSCSRVFEMPMSAYYVYAKNDDEDGNYRISGRATFVPLEYSIEHEWEPQL